MFIEQNTESHDCPLSEDRTVQRFILMFANPLLTRAFRTAGDVFRTAPVPFDGPSMYDPASLEITTLPKFYSLNALSAAPGRSYVGVHARWQGGQRGGRG